MIFMDEMQNIFGHYTAIPNQNNFIKYNLPENCRNTKNIVKYLSTVLEKEIKSLILGCTHYPLISSVINEILGSEITLINPAEATAADAKELLRVHNLLKTTQSAGTTEIYFSAELEKSKKLSQMILNNNTDLYKTVEL